MFGIPIGELAILAAALSTPEMAVNRSPDSLSDVGYPQLS
jgi:hypothetical protein